MRVVLVGLDRMTRDLIREMLARDPVEVLAEVPGEGPLEALETGRADVMIAGAGIAGGEEFCRVLERRGRSCVVAVEAGAGTSTLYELVPQVRALGELTPDLLRRVLAVRAG